MALRSPFKAYKLAALGVAIALAAGVALWLTRSDSDAPGVAQTPAASTAPQSPPKDAPQSAADGGAALPKTRIAMPEHLLAGDTHNTTADRIRARRSGSRPLFRDDQDFAQARAQQMLFAEGVSQQAIHQSPLANPRRLEDGRLWINYNMQVLAARAEGDRFMLPLPGADAALAEIDLVERVEGHYRWSGRILGQPGGTFTITQTFDDQYAIGKLSTPTAEYLIETQAGLGWVAEASQEFVLPPGGDDTLSDDGSHRGHSH